MIYIPCKEKQEWGTTTSAKVFFRERNEEIYENYIGGMGLRELAHSFSLSEKSIQRIVRNQRLVLSKGVNGRDIDFLKRNNAELK